MSPNFNHLPSSVSDQLADEDGIGWHCNIGNEWLWQTGDNCIWLMVFIACTAETALMKLPGMCDDPVIAGRLTLSLQLRRSFVAIATRFHGAVKVINVIVMTGE